MSRYLHNNLYFYTFFREQILVISDLSLPCPEKVTCKIYQLRDLSQDIKQNNSEGKLMSVCYLNISLGQEIDVFMYNNSVITTKIRTNIFTVLSQIDVRRPEVFLLGTPKHKT